MLGQGQLHGVLDASGAAEQLSPGDEIRHCLGFGEIWICLFNFINYIVLGNAETDSIVRFVL